VSVTLRRSISILAWCLSGVSAYAQPVVAGAGATFPEPIYTKWFEAFGKGRKDFRIRYEAIGSEAGMARLRDGSVDFAASDMPLDEAQLAALGRPVLQLPSTLGAVVPIYHVDGVSGDLHLTPEALAGIFLGQIKRWNDPIVQSANRDVRLPSRSIAVVHRSDGSGTTFVWADYLSKVSPQWKAGPGKGTTLQWPIGSGAEGNEGVAERVQATPDSIGYAELIYALHHRLSYAQVKNASGRFVEANLDSVAAAASDSALTIPNRFQFSITNTPGRKSYPIAAFTYLLVPTKTATPAKDAYLREFLRWMLTSGQREAAFLGYGSLPPEIVAREQQAIRELR